MVEEGFGRVDYTYNTLSQLKLETRQFTGLSGSYALSYTYNMGGGLTKLTNPFGVQVGYEHDQTGRLTRVMGANYAGVSTVRAIRRTSRSVHAAHGTRA